MISGRKVWLRQSRIKSKNVPRPCDCDPQKSDIEKQDFFNGVLKQCGATCHVSFCSSKIAPPYCRAAIPVPDIFYPVSYQLSKSHLKIICLKVRPNLPSTVPVPVCTTDNLLLLSSGSRIRIQSDTYDFFCTESIKRHGSGSWILQENFEK